MAALNPVELLKKELEELEISLAKSHNLRKTGAIDYGTHEIHKRNLIPMIEKYRLAIYKLEK